MSQFLIFIAIFIFISIINGAKNNKKSARRPATPSFPDDEDADDLAPAEPTPAPNTVSIDDVVKEYLKEQQQQAAERLEQQQAAERLAKQQQAAERLAQQQQAAERLAKQQEEAASSPAVSSTQEIVSQSIATAFPQGMKIAKSTRPGVHRPVRVNARGRASVRQGILMGEVLSRPRAFDL